MSDPKPSPEPLVPETVNAVDSDTPSLTSGAIERVDGDMAMYTAIVGKIPQIDPNAGGLFDEVDNRLARPQRPWSPMVMSLYLRQIYRQGALALHKPEIAAWIRRQSGAAIKRFHESQIRIAAARNDRAA